MSDRSAPHATSPQDWSPESDAIEWERLVDGEGKPYVAMLRHPAYPYPGRVDAALASEPGTFEVALKKIASAYLLRLRSLGTIAALRGWKAGKSQPWLRIAWGSGILAGQRDGRLSFWVERHAEPRSTKEATSVRPSKPAAPTEPETTTALKAEAERETAATSQAPTPAEPGTDPRPVCDRSLVLLAGTDCHGDAAERLNAGDERGLRVVMHVSVLDENATADEDGAVQVRITGASFGEAPVAAPAGPEAAYPLAGRAKLAPELYARVEQAFGIARGKVSIDGISSGPDRAMRVNGTATIGGSGGSGGGGGGGGARVCAWSARIVAGEGADPWRLESLSMVPRVAHAIEGFERDAASVGFSSRVRYRLPTRDEADLNAFRFATKKLPPPAPMDPPANAMRGPADPLPPGRLELKRDGLYEVRQNVLGNEGGDADTIQSVPDDALPLRTDHLAAAHAGMRAEEFFERLAVYGLAPASYFKLAGLPLLLRHRAAFKGVSDGVTVNASVEPVDHGHGFHCAWAGATQLEVNFGAAELFHRDRCMNDGRHKRAQYLGIAADPRWAWHEFGHVLIHAATGLLEFPFAHSAGDALAAIIGDPDSDLALDDRGVFDTGRPLRYSTFPWVRTLRRHDRQAAEGWGWCGVRNVRRHSTVPCAERVSTGYFAEQLLSTSLFRFYRAIGGDTAGDRVLRCNAADYAVYLVMRAIALLGPANLSPARSVDHFVSALIDADIGTREWTIVPTWPEFGPPAQRTRTGGMVHKVLRWAFEMQGLRATDDPSEIVEGAGRPPRVDIFIPGIGTREDGGYHPVALSWSEDTDAPAPGWHAGHQGIWRDGEKIVVKVAQRGQQVAHDVSVRVWARPVGNGPWWELCPVDPAHKTVGVRGQQTFEFHLPRDVSGHPADGPVLVFASAHCPADPSNLEPATGLPCATGLPPVEKPSLTDLVANDNNIALRAMDW